MKNKLTLDDKVLIGTMIILMILVAVEFFGMMYYKSKWKETEIKLESVK